MGILEDELNSHRSPEAVRRDEAMEEDRKKHGVLNSVMKSSLGALTQYETMREMAMMRSVASREETAARNKNGKYLEKREAADKSRDIASERVKSAESMKERVMGSHYLGNDREFE